MRLRTLLAGLAVLGMLTAGAAFGQVRVAKMDTGRPSPDESASATIGGKKVTVEYSSPRMKGRKIFGGLVPLGKVWRAGANEATVLTVEGDFMVGKLHVPAGSYALMAVPGESEWSLVVNKTNKQWGAFKYDEAQDLGRTPMKVAKAPAPVENFTITLESTGARSGVLKMMWENTVASVELMAH